jgi:hypothetical protein
VLSFHRIETIDEVAADLRAELFDRFAEVFISWNSLSKKVAPFFESIKKCLKAVIFCDMGPPWRLRG